MQMVTIPRKVLVELVTAAVIVWEWESEDDPKARKRARKIADRGLAFLKANPKQDKKGSRI